MDSRKGKAVSAALNVVFVGFNTAKSLWTISGSRSESLKEGLDLLMSTLRHQDERNETRALIS